MLKVETKEQLWLLGVAAIFVLTLITHYVGQVPYYIAWVGKIIFVGLLALLVLIILDNF